jgi:hypothetical protein
LLLFYKYPLIFWESVGYPASVARSHTRAEKRSSGSTLARTNVEQIWTARAVPCWPHWSTVSTVKFNRKVVLGGVRGLDTRVQWFSLFFIFLGISTLPSFP